jgi:hypothetical protein
MAKVSAELAGGVAEVAELGEHTVVDPRLDDAEVAAWRERRTARIEAQRAARAAAEPAPVKRGWWSRRRDR